MPSFLLTDLFAENHLVLDLKGTAPGEVIGEIVERLRESGELSEAKKFCELVMAREQKSSTVANGGVAFPHARTDLVEKIVLGIGRSQAGVNFAGKMVHLIFVIGVPQQMVNDYLICVGALARLLKSEQRRDALMQASDAAEFFERLGKEE